MSSATNRIAPSMSLPVHASKYASATRFARSIRRPLTVMRLPSTVETPPPSETERSVDDFADLVGPYRRELLLHCYRMLGSRTDAEDVLQETLLAAWRGLDGFEGRSSLRAWLYKIATNRCLNFRRRVPPALAPPF